ncbi:MAG TPA: ROK family protein [Ktedonobacteraceae bacterium]|nr:ROK family protein [Ktedonobacteraceae bacterium]
MNQDDLAERQTDDELPLVIGIDLGGTQIRTAVLQGGRLLSRISLLCGENATPERIIPRMFQAVEQALQSAGVTLQQIAGIGIGAPGPLNSHAGIVYCPPNLPGWENVPLRALFSDHFERPTYLENDANVAALAESLFGAGRGSDEIVYLTVSTGIGGGIISNGKIIEGIRGTAGELGHMTIDLHGERCNCGNIGCLEALASGTAMARQANRAIASGQGEELLAYAFQQQKEAKNSAESIDAHLHVNASMVAKAAQAGIPLAKEIIAQAARALGFGLVNVIHIFNPEVIILGGGVTQMGEMLLAPARHIVETRTMQIPKESARIVMAELGSDVGLIGAGALHYYHQSGRG